MLPPAEGMEDEVTLQFFAIVRYKNYLDLSTGSFVGVCVPKGFTVYTIEQDEKGRQGGKTVVFDDDQAQDETDDMMGLREMAKADKLDYTEMFPDVTTKGSGKKAKLAFGSTGQSSLYGPPPVTYSTQGQGPFGQTATKLTLDASVASKLLDPSMKMDTSKD